MFLRHSTLKRCKSYLHKRADIEVWLPGEDKYRDNSIKALNSAAGFIQRKLKKNLHLRSIPRIRFVIDNSLNEAEKINEIISSHQNVPH